MQISSGLSGHSDAPLHQLKLERAKLELQESKKKDELDAIRFEINSLVCAIAMLEKYSNER